MMINLSFVVFIHTTPGPFPPHGLLASHRLQQQSHALAQQLAALPPDPVQKNGCGCGHNRGHGHSHGNGEGNAPAPAAMVYDIMHLDISDTV